MCIKELKGIIEGVTIQSSGGRYWAIVSQGSAQERQRRLSGTDQETRSEYKIKES